MREKGCLTLREKKLRKNKEIFPSQYLMYQPAFNLTGQIGHGEFKSDLITTKIHTISKITFTTPFY